MISVVTKLYSEQRHYGSRGVKSRKSRSAAAAKARQIALNSKAVSASTEGSSTVDSTDDINSTHITKEYGNHNGNVHVLTLYSGKMTETDSAKVLTFIDNVTSKFEALPSWDLKKAKFDYSNRKEELLEQVITKYGDEVSENVSNEIFNELAKYSFDYTQHQIVIVFTSDESFEGARQTEDGTYRRELRTKRVYNKDKVLIPAVLRKALQDCSKEQSELTLTRTVGRGGKIVLHPVTGKKTFVVDFGGLTNRVFEYDNYS
jgi:hypothetical protein